MTANFTGQIHPYIEDLPIFEDKVDEIAESIDEVGLLHPITLDNEGRVIGGRHRLTACEVAGIDPTFEVWEGDALAFMLHDNDARKHQTVGQLAAEKAITLNRAGFRNEGRWKRGTTSYLKNSNSDNSSAAEMLSHAGVILDVLGEGPLREIASGRAKFSDVQAEAKRVREDQAEQKRREQELIDRERAEEEAAQHFFATHNAAGIWLAARPGKYDSIVAARTDYERHDREARLAREAEERAARAEQQRLHEEDQRVAQRLQSFTVGYSTAIDFRAHDRRDQVLACMDKVIRAEFLTLEDHITDWSHP